MNNRTQQRFDRSIREAAGRYRRENDRFQRARWDREDAQIRLSNHPPGEVLDALIAELVAKDNLQPEPRS